MIFWIAAVMCLYLVQIYLPAILLLPAEGLTAHAGPRDDIPDRGKFGGRAERALVNLKENLPFFLAPAILVLSIEGSDIQAAILAAQVFFLARIAYAVCYIAGIPWVRSLSYAIGLTANVYGFWALIG